MELHFIYSTMIFTIIDSVGGDKGIGRKSFLRTPIFCVYIYVNIRHVLKNSSLYMYIYKNSRNVLANTGLYMLLEENEETQYISRIIYIFII